ncbi:SulP family inorganic anion transporter [Larsenimonas suaedae]|uniref:Sulfate permease n=1 Tax=Larsenimonas suaedae TaxID=1851019 RepID=A0ABU1GTD8_9GAMM|nr:sulfate permease [Larsenimonas suaedae]MCM2971743.1 sulfate permease [Larsenimonas suaedae]MDR5895295.1 sulfate permease [Larsenimonas suaedae]
MASTATARRRVLKRLLPITEWLPGYNVRSLSDDALAAVIVTLMLIPQALAYALLAGVPAVVGLYASMLPLALYTFFGSSTTLSVGPMAVVSLMTASIASRWAAQGSGEYMVVVVALAALSGAMLLVMGLCRLGFFANFLSHPVIAGFISASALMIGVSQLPHLLGVSSSGDTLFAMLAALFKALPETNGTTLALGLVCIVMLLAARRWLEAALTALKLSAGMARFLTRLAPIVTVALATWATWGFGLESRGVEVLGTVASGLPSLSWPDLSFDQAKSLGGSALLISIIGFVEAMSVAQALATKRRERIDPDQELVGLGVANLGSAASGGFPVTGSLSRSVVNHEAGAATPASGLMAAVGVLIAIVTLTPVIAHLPTTVLSAIIIVSILSLLDVHTFVRSWRYYRGDAMAMLVTFVVTLWQGVETGLVTGAALSLMLYLYRTSRPHCAVLGRVPGTEHFRNIDRFEAVETDQNVIIVRIDESLYFANARFLEEKIDSLCAQVKNLKHLVLACQAINMIDASALDSLEEINQRLKESGIAFHLAEVKGPVMDRLKETTFLDNLGGGVHLSVYSAWEELHQG